MEYKQPSIATDAVLFKGTSVLLIERLNDPQGWALPGGFMEEGESCEDCVVRELLEETGLVGSDLVQLKVRSDPDRDPRKHIISVPFLVKNYTGVLKADDDAKYAAFFAVGKLPKLAFIDHSNIIIEALIQFTPRGISERTPKSSLR